MITLKEFQALRSAVGIVRKIILLLRYFTVLIFKGYWNNA